MNMLNPALWPMLIPAFAGWVNDNLGYRPYWQTEPQYSAKLETILDRWGKSLSEIQTAEAQISQYTYNKVFAVEQRGNGRLIYTNPNRIRYEVRPRASAIGEHSWAKSHDGKRYTLRGLDAVTWEFDGKHLVRTSNRGQREIWANVDPINPRQITLLWQGLFSNRIPTPTPLQYTIPVFLGLDASDLKRLYSWNLLKETKTNYWLRATRRSGSKNLFDRRVAGRRPTTTADSYPRSTLIVNKTTWLPEAMRMTDVTGNYETVYVAYGWDVKTKPKLKKP